jgi:hypothetical protein
LGNFNVKYKCNLCGRTSFRSIGGWELECSCGGTMNSLSPDSKLRSTRINGTKRVTKCISLDN